MTLYNLTVHFPYQVEKEVILLKSSIGQRVLEPAFMFQTNELYNNFKYD